MTSRELGQVRVGDLAVADDPLDGDVRVGNVVRPEFVPGAGGSLAEYSTRRGGWLAFADEQPHQAALCHGASGEAAGRVGEPVLRGCVMNVVGDEQGDKDVGVEEDRHWSSSSSPRTSSVVIVRPRCTTGSPVRSLVAVSAGWPEPSPRRMSCAT